MQRRWKSPLGLAAAGLMAVLWSAVVPPALAQEDGEPTVPLDQLLKIPSSVPAVEGQTARRGGNTKSEWQSLYARAIGNVERAERQLEETRTALDERVGESSSWQMAAPGIGGGGPTDSPVDYKLSQDLRRHREELRASQRRLQELDVEANLAGVPAHWRGPTPADDAAAPAQ